MKRPAHRPLRSYPEAPVHWTHVELDKCPFCGAVLITTSSREVDKYVQTLNGPVHVIGYSRKCSNADCPQPQARYHATQGAKLSLPHVTYGLDVMAYIAYRRNGEQKQFKEIWHELETEFEIEISEREVGRLYRKIQALLLGNQVAIHRELAAAAEKYGQLIMVVDGLQPDGGGPKLYILHEVLSGVVVSVAMIDQATEVNLRDWLRPYGKWRGVVKATLSDKEGALVAALKTTWPEAPHQLCQLHFVKDLSEVVHEADRDLQKRMREAMGQLPPVPALDRESEGGDEAVPEASEATCSDEGEKALPPQPSPALMEAIDIISGVKLEALDAVSPVEWERLLPGRRPAAESDPGAEDETSVETLPLSAGSGSQGEDKGSTPVYLSAAETVEWLTETLLAQVPVSSRSLVETTPSDEAVTHWEHTRYRQAIQDTRHRSSRKPFVCGGLRGYDQLRAIADYLAARQEEEGLDPYLSQLRLRAQRTVEQVRPLADEVRQAQGWIVRIEELLVDEPTPDGLQPPSATQRQRMRALRAECQAQDQATPTLQALRRTWQRMLASWGPDLYHCYDIEGLPRSNLGIEALLGQARRQQRRLRGQADTSPLAVTGQGYLRATSAGQSALLEVFQQVPTWVYRCASRCVEAVEAGVRWPKQLHRDTTQALQWFQAQAEALRRHVTLANVPP